MINLDVIWNFGVLQEKQAVEKTHVFPIFSIFVLTNFLRFFITTLPYPGSIEGRRGAYIVLRAFYQKPCPVKYFLFH